MLFRSTPPPAQGRAAAGLVAWYDFEGTSKAVADRSGLGNVGTLRGARRTRAGKQGKAVYLDGRRDHVRVADSASLDLSRAMTLEAWVRPSKGGGRGVAIVKRRARGISYALFARGGGRVSAGVRTKRGHRSRAGNRLRVKKWSHIASTYNGRTLRVYVNGRLQSRRRVRGAIATGGGALKIGAHFKGRIDDVRIWSTALSGRTIRRHGR